MAKEPIIIDAIREPGWILGVDIASPQRTNFPMHKLHDGDVKFVFMRATHGTLEDKDHFWRDPTFYENWNNAKKEGFFRGAYGVTHPLADPIKQAHGFMETVGILDIDDAPFMVDYEMFPKGMTRDQHLTFIDKHCSEIERISGKRPFFYAGLPLDEYVGAPRDECVSRYLLWLAQYSKRVFRLPKQWTDWTIWQATGNYGPFLPGFNMRIDRNFFRGTLQELKDLCKTQHKDFQTFEFRTVLGLQRVLTQLGYQSGKIDDVMGDKTRGALMLFQKEHSLDTTGKLNPQTIDALNNDVRLMQSAELLGASDAVCEFVERAGEVIGLNMSLCSLSAGELDEEPITQPGE